MNEADANIDMFECILLSALMNGSDALPVCADDFGLPPTGKSEPPPNRTIFKRISGLENRSLLALIDALQSNGELEKVGGRGRINEIANLRHDADSVAYALVNVLDHSTARQAAKIGEQMQMRELTPEQAQEKLATLIKTKANTIEREPRIRFFSPRSLRDFVPDKDIVLIGDCHIMRGEVFVIGGEPGVGKSLGATRLAVSGATQRDWFGHTVHRRFRTMIVQTENGRYR
jgi:replicative DNA helicase